MGTERRMEHVASATEFKLSTKSPIFHVKTLCMSVCVHTAVAHCKSALYGIRIVTSNLSIHEPIYSPLSNPILLILIFLLIYLFICLCS